MQINSTNNPMVSNNQDMYAAFKENAQKEKPEEKELTVEEQMEKSAIEVSISMGAQILLFAMDSQDVAINNTQAQKDILDFLSGKEVEGELSLSDIGYDGKPITELTPEEAEELISEDGFFGVEKTAQRVADFVFNFSDDDLDIIQKGRDGIVQGFEEAEKMWGGELPEISYKTQAKTLELIDARIAELKENK